MTFRYFNLAAALVLAACGATPGAGPQLQISPAQMASAASAAQFAWGLVKVAANGYALMHPQYQGAIAKAETDLEPQFAQLSSDAAPTSIKAVLSNLSQHLLALPPGIIPAKAQQAIDIAALAGQGVANFALPAAPAAPAAPATTVAPVAPAVSG